jgi:ribosomal protein L21E
MDTLISDRGTSFTSGEMEKWCEERGIKQVLNSPRHPQANGMVERVNRILIPMISIRIQRSDQKDWDLGILEVERDLNNSQNRVTGRTPFEIVHGFRPVFQHEAPLHKLSEFAERTRYVPPPETWDKVRKRVSDEQARIKKYYDRRHFKAESFSIGDMVVMQAGIAAASGQPRKTLPKYRGPMTVVRVLPGDTYSVVEMSADMSKQTYATNAHISQLKLYRVNAKDNFDDNYLGGYESVLETEDDSTEEFATPDQSIQEADGATEPLESNLNQEIIDIPATAEESELQEPMGGQPSGVAGGSSRNPSVRSHGRGRTTMSHSTPIQEEARRVSQRVRKPNPRYID